MDDELKHYVNLEAERFRHELHNEVNELRRDGLIHSVLNLMNEVSLLTNKVDECEKENTALKSHLSTLSTQVETLTSNLSEIEGVRRSKRRKTVYL